MLCILFLADRFGVFGYNLYNEEFAMNIMLNGQKLYRLLS